MKQFFIPIYFLTTSVCFSSLTDYPSQNLKLTRTFLEQECLHQEQNLDFYGNLLNFWAGALDNKKADVVYLFWEENKNLPWLIKFINRLKTDLASLKIKVLDRVILRREVTKVYSAETSGLLKAHRIIYIGAERDYSSNSDALNTDGKYLVTMTERLASEYLKLEERPALKEKGILPLQVNGSNLFLPFGLSSQDKYCLPVETLESFTYLELIKRLTRFSYDLKENTQVFGNAEAELINARPGIRAVLTGLSDAAIHQFLCRLKK